MKRQSKGMEGFGSSVLLVVSFILMVAFAILSFFQQGLSLQLADAGIFLALAAIVVSMVSDRDSKHKLDELVQANVELRGSVEGLLRKLGEKENQEGKN